MYIQHLKKVMALSSNKEPHLKTIFLQDYYKTTTANLLLLLQIYICRITNLFCTHTVKPLKTKFIIMAFE